MSSGSTSDITSRLSVGLGCVFTPDQSQPKERIQVIVRGWSEGKYLIVEQVSGGARQPLLRKGGQSVLRFLSEGMACAASTWIVEWRTGPYTRLAWPESIEFLTVRKQARVHLDSPCTLHVPDGEDIPVRLRDVSSTGCGVLTEEPLNTDDEISLSFVLPDGAPITETSFTVRNVRQMGEREFIAGCLLTDFTSAVRHDLEFFVASSVMHDRRSESENSTILIIDHDSTVYERADWLRDKGYEVSVAVDMVDGFFKLRLSLPAVVLVATEQRASSGGDVCKFIRAARGLDALPVYLYGADAASQASAAGATGNIDSLEGEAWFDTIASHLPEQYSGDDEGATSDESEEPSGDDSSEEETPGEEAGAEASAEEPEQTEAAEGA